MFGVLFNFYQTKLNFLELQYQIQDLRGSVMMMCHCFSCSLRKMKEPSLVGSFCWLADLNRTDFCCFCSLHRTTNYISIQFDQIGCFPDIRMISLLNRRLLVRTHERPEKRKYEFWFCRFSKMSIFVFNGVYSKLDSKRSFTVVFLSYWAFGVFILNKHIQSL